MERHFSLDALRQLFEFHPDTLSDTHDTFKCKRCRNGKQLVKAPAMLYGDTSSWNHFTNSEGGGLDRIQDLLLRQEIAENIVSSVFQYISHVSNIPKKCGELALILIFRLLVINRCTGKITCGDSSLIL